MSFTPQNPDHADLIERLAALDETTATKVIHEARDKNLTNAGVKKDRDIAKQTVSQAVQDYLAGVIRD